MNIKIFITGILIYLILAACQNKVGLFKKEYVDMYFLSDSVFKGVPLDINIIKTVKVEKEFAIENNILTHINDKMYFSKNLESGCIIKKSDITDNKELMLTNDLELLSIKLDANSSIMANQMKEKDYINIYYTCKNKYEDNALNKLENVKVQNGFNTYLLYEKIKVIKILNKNGKEISENESANYILVALPRDDILIYNSIKENGSFSASISK